MVKNRPHRIICEVDTEMTQLRGPLHRGPREPQHRHPVAFPSCCTLQERQSPYWHRPGNARRRPLLPLRLGQYGDWRSCPPSPLRPSVQSSMFDVRCSMFDFFHSPRSLVRAHLTIG